MSAHGKMSATQNVGAWQNVSYSKCRRMVKCQLLKMSAHGKMSATQNVGFLLKMSALKKYSKFKSKCAYINHSKSNYTCAYINVSTYKSACAYNLRSASKLLLFGLGGLSTLLSFSARLKFSFFSFYSF